MSIHFDKTIMMCGDDYPVTDNIVLHHPSIGEMSSISKKNSEYIYWKYIQLVMCDPYSNMVMLDDMGIDFMKVSPFDVFILQWKQFDQEYKSNKDIYDLYGYSPNEMINQALNFFMTGEHRFVYTKYENGEECVYDNNNSKCQINREIFDYLYEWIKTINHIDYSNRINPADENARRILIEDTRDEIKKQKRRQNKDNNFAEHIGLLISAVCFGGNGVINPFNIKNCKMYWIFEDYRINTKKTNASHILDGFYHGTISKSDIREKDLDWIK